MGERLNFQAIFDHASQFMGMLDLEGHLVEVNRTALAFAGCERAAVIGQPFWDTPWWREAGDEIRDQLRHAIARAAAGEPVRYETINLDPQGRPICVDFSLRPLRTENNRFSYLIAEGYDVTSRHQLRESEERLRLISENVDDLIAILDAGGRRIYNSPSYKRILGDSAEPGSDSFERIHPDDRDRIRVLFRSVMETRRGALAEYRYILPDGSIKIVESQSSVVLNDAGAVENVLVVARDVTGRRQAEAENRALN